MSTGAIRRAGFTSIKAGGDFRIEPVEKVQTVSVGQSVTFHITIVAEDKFGETVTLSATSQDLPAQVTKTFSHAAVQPTGSTTLDVIVPYATDAEDYTIKIDAISITRSHETYLQLKIVNPGTGESLITDVPDRDYARLGEKIYISGQIIPWQPPGTHMEVHVKPPGAADWVVHPYQLDEPSGYRFDYEPAMLGDYPVRAAWAGDQSETASLKVGKGQSRLRCSTDTEDIEPGTTVAIQVELKPGLAGVPFHLDIFLSPGRRRPSR